MQSHPKVVLQDPDAGWLFFDDPREVVEARCLPDVRPALSRIERGVASGLTAAGFLTYEAAPAFDRALRAKPPGLLPLLWFGLYEKGRRVSCLEAAAGGMCLGDWRPSPSRDAYLRALNAIHRLIGAGDTYQVNYTIRLKSTFAGDAFALFTRMVRAQRPQHAAFVDLGSVAVCSASPELFLERNGRVLTSRPMKGTAARMPDCDRDDAAAEGLRQSEKNRAENVMIVDMVRNDMGRIAAPGTVRVTRPFTIERYPTVLQMTSTVTCETDASFTAILDAMFPCASITGAPKVRTMEIIDALEPEPRGVYTGSIGYLAPGNRACFNVAIRTVTLDRGEGTAEYGTGGGIVWDSEWRDEYAECLTKAAVLAADVPDFELLETLRWTPEAGWFLLERHLDRLARSARYFGFACDRDAVRTRLATCIANARAPRRVRLLLRRDGAIETQASGFDPDARAGLRIAFATRAVSRDNPFLYHKTTHRRVYDEARAGHAEADDVILFNEAGEVTESTIGNVVCEIDGEMVTPPVSSGLLAGTFRAELLARGEIRERVITRRELEQAPRMFLINSVREWVRAVWADKERYCRKSNAPF